MFTPWFKVVTGLVSGIVSDMKQIVLMITAVGGGGVGQQYDVVGRMRNRIQRKDTFTMPPWRGQIEWVVRKAAKNETHRRAH